MSEREQFAERFAFNLFKARRQAGLTQEELAKRTGLHRTEIGLLEHCRRLPRLDTFVKLCGALEVEPDQLLEGVDWHFGKQKFVCARTRVSELIGPPRRVT